jgi:hypothetical protein
MEMNERIEQLASQAGMLRDKYGLYWNAHDNLDDGVDLEYFTELIVRECMHLVENCYLEPESGSSPHLTACASTIIEEYFGVE